MSATDGGIGSVATSAVPSFANTRSTSGNCARRASSCELHADRLREAGAGDAQRVQRDVAFVQARDELAAHARGQRGAQRDERDGAGDGCDAEAQRSAQQRLVGAARAAHDDVLVLGDLAAHEQRDGSRHERHAQSERARSARARP